MHAWAHFTVHGPRLFARNLLFPSQTLLFKFALHSADNRVSRIRVLAFWAVRFVLWSGVPTSLQKASVHSSPAVTSASGARDFNGCVDRYGYFSGQAALRFWVVCL